jgi:L-serine dehydratase
MQSLKELYKVGPGPSSSHTLAPYRSLLLFIKRYGLLDHYKVELFGSLSLT